MNVWTVILTAGIGTLVLRVGMVAAADRIRIPAWLDRASALVAPAALAALAVTSMADAGMKEGAGAFGALAPIIAVAVGGLAVVRTRKPHIAMLVGMPTLWLLTALMA